MICPACDNPLTEFQVGTVKVDVCDGGCGGIWFDAFELRRVDDQFELAGEPLMAVRRDARLVVDLQRKRDCPRCDGIKLKRHFYSAKKQVEVDHCPNCGGHWLDANELQKIREERALDEAAEKTRQPYLTPEVIRYLYRMKVIGQKER